MNRSHVRIFSNNFKDKNNPSFSYIFCYCISRVNLLIKTTIIVEPETFESKMNETSLSKCYAMEQFTYNDTGIVVTAVVSVYFSCSIGFVATFGNGLILYAIFKENTLAKPSNLLLAFLAVTDVLAGMLSMPANIVIRIMDLNNNSAPCSFLLVYRHFTTMLITVSYLVFGLLSMDVFLAVKYPIKYKIWDLAKLYKCIYSMSWLLLCLLSAGLALNVVGRGIVMSVLLLVISATLICVIWWCCRVYFAIRVNDVQVEDMVSAQVAAKRRKKGKRNALTIAMIIIVFTLCSLPMIIGLVITRGEKPTTFYHFSTYSGILMFLSSALNPMIFICRKEAIQIIVLKVLSKTANRVQYLMSTRMATSPGGVA